MAVVSLGSVDALAEAGRKLVAVDGHEIGVFHVRGNIYAWKNRCPHQGGPVCQGRTFNLVEEVIDEARCSHGRTYNEEKLNIVCPWHGAEFDIETGRGVGGSNWSLQPVKVFVESGEVMIDV